MFSQGETLFTDHFQDCYSTYFQVFIFYPCLQWNSPAQLQLLAKKNFLFLGFLGFFLASS